MDKYKFDKIIDAINIINEKIDKTNNILGNFMEVSIKKWEQQMIFNERFYNKLEKFEQTFKKFIALEERVKHLETLEARVAKIEHLLNAS